MRFRSALIVVSVVLSLFCAAQDRRTMKCESNDGRYKRCALDQVGRVELRRQISGTPCTLNTSWGYDQQGLWVDRGCRAEFEVFIGPAVQIVRCESNDDFQVCPAGPNTAVRLHRQISGSPCRETYSWGRRSEAIWVDRGCRAEFEVVPRSPNDPPERTRIVRCDSGDERYHFCPTGQIDSAELNRQLSGSACRHDVSWGQRGDGVWVDKGCRAEFAVTAVRRLVPRTIRCNSDDGGYRVCSTGAIERAQMTHQVSGSPCREGQSWGRRSDGVWVDKGCRAEFEVFSYAEDAAAAPDQLPAPTANSRVIRCESDDGQYRFCMAGTVRSATLAKRLSDAECRLDYSWGYREDGVWVDRGCRAEFRLIE